MQEGETVMAFWSADREFTKQQSSKLAVSVIKKKLGVESVRGGMRTCNQVKSLHIPEVLAAVTSHQTQSLHGGLNLHHQCLNGSHKLHGKIHAVIIFFPRMVEWSSTACLQFPLTFSPYTANI